MARSVERLAGVELANIGAEVFQAGKPKIFTGAVAHWPLVKCQNVADVKALMMPFDGGRPFVCYQAPNRLSAGFGYDAECRQFNFDKSRLTLAEFFTRVEAHASGESEQITFAPSLHLDSFLPGFRASQCDQLPQLDEPLMQAWMGGPSLVPAHFDALRNLACCLVGERRFTLYKPEDLSNLYVGPLDKTPAGQAVSLVNPNAVDLNQHPAFATAEPWVAELSPGDVLYLPPMWWHQVEGRSSFNLMINYWWRSVPQFHGDPIHALFHAMLAVRDLPEAEKNAWAGLFEHYVFGDPADGRFDHIPANAKGRLGDIDESMARQIRAQLLQALNR